MPQLDDWTELKLILRKKLSAAIDIKNLKNESPQISIHAFGRSTLQDIVDRFRMIYNLNIKLYFESEGKLILCNHRDFYHRSLKEFKSKTTPHQIELFFKIASFKVHYKNETTKIVKLKDVSSSESTNYTWNNVINQKDFLGPIKNNDDLKMSVFLKNDKNSKYNIDTEQDISFGIVKALSKASNSTDNSFIDYSEYKIMTDFQLAPTSPNFLRVFINRHTKKIPIVLPNNATVEELKKLVLNEVDLSPGQLCLLFDCERLEEDRSLSYYEIECDDTIDLFLRAVGGMYHPSSAVSRLEKRQRDNDNDDDEDKNDDADEEESDRDKIARLETMLADSLRENSILKKKVKTSSSEDVDKFSDFDDDEKIYEDWTNS